LTGLRVCVCVCVRVTAGTQRADKSHGGTEPSKQVRQSPVVGGGEAAEADARQGADCC